PTSTPHPTPPAPPSPNPPTAPAPPPQPAPPADGGSGTTSLPATGAGFTQLIAGTAVLAALCGSVTLVAARRRRR
ncbi:hypothetical protein J0695_07165, partial [Streptomyces beijiangensis]|nr:hypothetical protein [Streptomyces beijiangensis]